MEKQTLVLTALPNGFTPDSRPRLSVFISPRLWTDTPGVESLPLERYPDLLDWPTRVAALTWEVSIDAGASKPLTVDDNAPKLKPELWRALFRDSTQVKPFGFEDLRGTPLEVLPIWEVHETLSALYGRASSDLAYGQGRQRPGLDVLATDPDLSAVARPSFPEPEPQWNPPETASIPFPNAPQTTEEPEPQGPEPESPGWSCGSGFFCILLGLLVALICWLLGLMERFLGWPVGCRPADAQAPVSPEAPSSVPVATPSFKTDVTPPDPPAPPAPGKVFMPPPLTPDQERTRAAFETLESCLKPFEGANLTLPDAAALAEEWDFHQGISALGDYPVLLRWLGLVVDLLLPPGTTLPAAGTIRISTGMAGWSPGTRLVAPLTHFVSDATLFTAAPRPVLPEIAEGFLRIDDAARFRVIQNDVPGDAIKVRNTATHSLRFALPEDRPGNLPGEGGLPALRTAGLSLIRKDMATELVDQWRRSYALNLSLASQDDSPVPPPAGDDGAPPQGPSEDLYAEDLVRGYRIDIFDTKTEAWRSLLERKGTYRFLEAEGGPVMESAEDEGFVQAAATEPLDPTVPRLLRTTQSIFTWSGWSLAAPRPGKSLPLDDTQPDPPNTAATPFKLETSFRALPGSLPRLRFGRRYRIRARMADLAGNSVVNPGDPAYANEVVATTPEQTALRYEPVAPPNLMLQAAPVEGESVEHMVVRTPAVGGLGDLTARHVAPPKTSQAMAELSGQFDASGLGGSPAGYALAARESNSVKDAAHQVRPALNGLPGEVPATPSEADPWVDPNPLVAVTYLPDPQARGVALTGLPGEPNPDTLRSIAFLGAWPDLSAFRIDLKAIPAGTLPSAPDWNAPERVLTVQLAPAQRATVRINSIINEGDLEGRGVWHWTAELAPANLAEVKSLVVQGRHWAHLPWREITLVHAVQQPLAPPSIDTIDPEKSLGKSFVTLSGNLHVDAPSTARVQLRAVWTDPVDDPGEPEPGTQSCEASVAEVVVPEGAGSVDIVDSGTGVKPRHELFDTKYHLVDYTPVGVTRFAEYFPQSSNTQDATTSTGAVATAVIKNSARPDAPNVLYVLPLFDWDTPPGTPLVYERTRRGGGLRVYLERPWYSSGAGELLGVVFLQDKPFLELDEALKPLVTHWGADPIWSGSPVPVSAQPCHFLEASELRSGLTLEEHAATVAVAGYPVTFDKERKLWLADLNIDTGNAYWPFVRLALARFQPQSVNDAHLSRIHLTDFIQVPPSRTAKISIADSVVHIDVKGPSYASSELVKTIEGRLSGFGGAPGSNGLSEIEVVIEASDLSDDPANELVWNPASAKVLLFQDPEVPGVWKGDITAPLPLPGKKLRLRLKEFEWFRRDDEDAADTHLNKRWKVGRRVTYADVFPL